MAWDGPKVARPGRRRAWRTIAVRTVAVAGSSRKTKPQMRCLNARAVADSLPCRFLLTTSHGFPISYVNQLIADKGDCFNS